MDKKDVFAVSALMESISREDFAIHLYGRQHHRDPFAAVPLAPLYYVLNEVYYLTPSPVIFGRWPTMTAPGAARYHRPSSIPMRQAAAANMWRHYWKTSAASCRWMVMTAITSSLGSIARAGR